MSVKGYLQLLIVFVLFSQCSGIQNIKADKEIASPPKVPRADREFRAAWIASVANINWPSKPGLSVVEQKQEAIQLLDFLKENNFNAVILQVRPQCDALYNSSLEPWSYYLTGEQGKKPELYYDPLQFWIEETHKRALEFHAWLNPYRAHHVCGGPVSEHSIVKTHPELVAKLEGGYYWMIPTEKGTQDHSYNVVMDIVKRYDVDGIHFDDYFYPYPSYNNNKDFPDHESWQKYLNKGGKLSKGDWRRNAVNQFMERLYKGIKSEKKHVKFGLSPFGIWRPNNPPSIKGFDQYAELYADAKLWLNKGWIDYWTPQLYWTINKIPQSFPVLVDWWKKQNYKNRHFWPGISPKGKNGSTIGDEAFNQIMITRGMLSESPGIVYWNINALLSSSELTQTIKNGPYQNTALVPASPWLDNKPPLVPLVTNLLHKDTLRVTWTCNQKPDIASYVVYAQYGSEWQYRIVGRNSRQICLPAYQVKSVSEKGSIKKANDLFTPLKQIAVVAVDKFGNESEFKSITVLEKTKQVIPCLVNELAYDSSQKETDAELRAIYIEPESWFDKDTKVAQNSLSRRLSLISHSNYNAVFLKLNKSTSAYKGLSYGIKTAQDLNLKVFIVVDSIDAALDKLLEDYDVDGLALETNDLSSLEQKVVVLKQIKPYLQISLKSTDQQSSDQVNKLLQNRIVDLVHAKVSVYTDENNNWATKYTEKKDFPSQSALTHYPLVLDISELLKENGNNKVYVGRKNREVPINSSGEICYITKLTDTLQITCNEQTVQLATKNFRMPYRYKITGNGQTVRMDPWLEYRGTLKRHVNKECIEVLFKTNPDAKATINGKQVKVYKTGVFFDKICLQEGINRICATVEFANTPKATFYKEIVYQPETSQRNSFPIWIDEKSIEPAQDRVLTPKDQVQLKFKGSKGQDAFIMVQPAGIKVPCMRTDHHDYSVYSADLAMTRISMDTPNNLFIYINDLNVFPVKKTITVKDEGSFPYLKIIKNNTRLNYNLGSVRLGGPVRAELDSGVIMKANGVYGDSYRIRLNGTETGVVAKENVTELPAHFSQKKYFITNLSCAPNKDGDVVSIPYLEPIPYEINAEPENKRIVIRLFGAKTSSTWITHRANLKVIDRVSWEQITPDTYEIYVHLKTSKCWGYELVKQGKRLRLKVKYAPVYNLKSRQPLKGLKIAIEAGHGGDNTGAIGLSGLLEKDINLDLSLKLGEICSHMGAEVVQVRSEDKYMGLLEKRQVAIDSQADLLISIHANAAGGGYLRVAGTSMYYHNPFSDAFAKNLYARLLETGLKEFGVVGAFNYSVIRTTHMPAVLVEQAFLSHAEDEEKLADPVFLDLMAEKLYRGVLDYLEYMCE